MTLESVIDTLADQGLLGRGDAALACSLLPSSMGQGSVLPAASSPYGGSSRSEPVDLGGSKKRSRGVAVWATSGGWSRWT